MSTIESSRAPDRAQTSELLVILYRYLEANTTMFPVLLPAVEPLREAAQRYGRDDVAGALERGVAVYRLLESARVANAALPVP